MWKNLKVDHKHTQQVQNQEKKEKKIFVPWQQFYSFVYLANLNGVVAQFWLEHRPVTPEVASSSLVYPVENKKTKKEPAGIAGGSSFAGLALGY